MRRALSARGSAHFFDGSRFDELETPESGRFFLLEFFARLNRYHHLGQHLFKAKVMEERIPTLRTRRYHSNNLFISGGRVCDEAKCAFAANRTLFRGHVRLHGESVHLIRVSTR